MVTGVTDGVSDFINPSNYETNGFGKVCLHRSENLTDWTFVGYCVESLGELGTMLECPNIFKLSDKHVLMYSPMGMQQRQVVYLVGDMDYQTGKFHWSTQMFKAAWDTRHQLIAQGENTLKSELIAIDNRKAELINRIVDSKSQAVIAAYETKLEQLDQDRLVINEKLTKSSVPKERYDQFIELSMSFLANPWNLWSSGQFQLKRLVLRLAFAERIEYDWNSGYRTPKISLPFKVLGGILVTSQ